MMFKHLQEFRQTLYNSLGNARDALFDLMDAVLVSGCILSFAALSQSPMFRRQWSSTYGALHDGRVPQAKVFKLLVGEIPKAGQPILAGDLSDWNRPAAKSLKDRTFNGGRDKGVSVGHRYSTLTSVLVKEERSG